IVFADGNELGKIRSARLVLVEETVFAHAREDLRYVAQERAGFQAILMGGAQRRTSECPAGELQADPFTFLQDPLQLTSNPFQHVRHERLRPLTLRRWFSKASDKISG